MTLEVRQMRTKRCPPMTVRGAAISVVGAGGAVARASAVPVAPLGWSNVLKTSERN